MSKHFWIIVLFCLPFGIVSAQNIGFRYSGALKFLNAANDTLTNAFTGGFNAPQFNSIDINLDGKKDLLVFDRSGAIIHPYINIGNAGEIKYHYAPQYRNRFPHLINWVRIEDYDHDGKEDIFTNADPNEPHDSNIFVQNNHVRVYKNTSTVNKLQFTLMTPSLTCIYSYGEDGVIVSATDMPDVKDIDGDGDLDMVSIQNTGAFVYYFKNYQVEKGLPADSFKFYNVDTRWGSVMITDKITLGQTIEKSYFKMNAHTNGTTLSLFDQDGDGDFDLYTGDPANDFLYYVKNGKKEFNWKYNGFSSDTMIAYDSVIPRNTVQAKLHSSLTAWFLDINNDGKKDLIVSPNSLEDVKTKNNMWLYLNTGTLSNAQFTFVKNNFLQEETIDVGEVFAPALLDYDQDGDMDIIAATKGDWEYWQDASDQLALLKNVGSKQKPVFKLIDSNYLNISSLNLINMKVATGDLNGDGKTDIILSDYDGSLTYLENNSGSTGNLTFKPAVVRFKNISEGVAVSPAIFDLNHDGKGDLILGLTNGFIHYYRNTGKKATGPDFSSIPTSDSLGQIHTIDLSNQNLGYASPAFFNSGHDSTIEMLTGSYTGRVNSYRMQAALEKPFVRIDSVLQLAEDSVFANNSAGDQVRCSPLVADFDEDTIPDLLLGMRNGGALFFKGYYRGNMPYILGYDTVRTIDTSTFNGIKTPVHNVQVYPNPFNHQLSVSGVSSDASYALFNSVGEVVWTGNLQAGTSSIYANVTGGLYILQIRFPESVVNLKVIKTEK